jgi:hypothetical protein
VKTQITFTITVPKPIPNPHGLTQTQHTIPLSSVPNSPSPWQSNPSTTTSFTVISSVPKPVTTSLNHHLIIN